MTLGLVGRKVAEAVTEAAAAACPSGGGPSSEAGKAPRSCPRRQIRPFSPRVMTTAGETSPKRVKAVSSSPENCCANFFGTNQIIYFLIRAKVPTCTERRQHGRKYPHFVALQQGLDKSGSWPSNKTILGVTEEKLIVPEVGVWFHLYNDQALFSIRFNQYRRE